MRKWRHSNHNVRSVHIRADVKRHGATGGATTSQRSMEKLYGEYIEYLFWCVLSSLVIGILIYIYWGLCDALFSFLLRWLEECDGN